jgi:uncharacterized protein YjaG (DUF416 family)
MVRKESIPDFDSWLSALPGKLVRYPAPHIQLFIASCCERQQTNYAAFAEDARWGDPTLLREAGEILWGVNDSLSDTYLKAIARAIAKATPDTEEFHSPLTAAALDAAVSLREGLEFITDPDPRHCINVCTLIRDTIYMTLEQDGLSPATSGFAELLRLAELEIRELLQQESDLQVLAEVDDLDPTFVTSFRLSAAPDGKSNLGI